MTDTYKVLGQGTKSPGTGAVTMYTVPAATQAIVKFMSFIQDGNALAATYTIELDAQATPLGFGKVTLQTDEWAEWEGSLAMNAGQVLKLNLVSAAGGGGIIWNISGVEIT
jgi:hypothetical protein